MNERKFQHLFGHVIERLRVASPVEQARDAFNIGVSFHSMARSCVDQLVDQDEFEADCVPMVVNYAFSCELYLKSLILRRGGKHKKLHYLDSLYRELTAPEREGILSLYKNHTKCTDDEFEEELAGFRNAFKDWRYNHEAKALRVIEVQALIFFTTCVYLFLRETCPDWINVERDARLLTCMPQTPIAMCWLPEHGQLIMAIGRPQRRPQ